MCTLFNEGNCEKGKDCNFSDGLSLADKPKDGAAQRGRSWATVPKCQNRDGSSSWSVSSIELRQSGLEMYPWQVKQMACYHHMGGKFKTSAESCSFAHRPATEVEQLQKQVATDRRRAMGEVRRTMPCTHMRDGKCNRGGGCPEFAWRQYRGRGQRHGGALPEEPVGTSYQRNPPWPPTSVPMAPSPAHGEPLKGRRRLFSWPTRLVECPALHRQVWRDVPLVSAGWVLPT